MAALSDLTHMLPVRSGRNGGKRTGSGTLFRPHSCDHHRADGGHMGITFGYFVSLKELSISLPDRVIVVTRYIQPLPIKK